MPPVDDTPSEAIQEVLSNARDVEVEAYYNSHNRSKRFEGSTNKPEAARLINRYPDLKQEAQDLHNWVASVQDRLAQGDWGLQQEVDARYAARDFKITERNLLDEGRAMIYHDEAAWQRAIAGLSALTRDNGQKKIESLSEHGVYAIRLVPVLTPRTSTTPAPVAPVVSIGLRTPAAPVHQTPRPITAAPIATPAPTVPLHPAPAVASPAATPTVAPVSSIVRYSTGYVDEDGFSTPAAPLNTAFVPAEDDTTAIPTPKVPKTPTPPVAPTAPTAPIATSPAAVAATPVPAVPYKPRELFTVIPLTQLSDLPKPLPYGTKPQPDDARYKKNYTYGEYKFSYTGTVFHTTTGDTRIGKWNKNADGKVIFRPQQKDGKRQPLFLTEEDTQIVRRGYVLAPHGIETIEAPKAPKESKEQKTPRITVTSVLDLPLRDFQNSPLNIYDCQGATFLPRGKVFLKDQPNVFGLRKHKVGEGVQVKKEGAKSRYPLLDQDSDQRGRVLSGNEIIRHDGSRSRPATQTSQVQLQSAVDESDDYEVHGLAFDNDGVLRRASDDHEIGTWTSEDGIPYLHMKGYDSLPLLIYEGDVCVFPEAHHL